MSVFVHLAAFNVWLIMLQNHHLVMVIKLGQFQMQIEQSKLINVFCIEFEWTNVKYETKLLCLILMDFECSFD